MHTNTNYTYLLHTVGRDIRRKHIIYLILKTLYILSFFINVGVVLYIPYILNRAPGQGITVIQFIILAIGAMISVALNKWAEKWHHEIKALFKHHFIVPLAAENDPGIKYEAKGNCDADPITDWMGGNDAIQEDTFQNKTAPMPYACSEIHCVTHGRNDTTHFRGYVWHIETGTKLCESLTYHAFSYDRITLSLSGSYGTPTYDRKMNGRIFKRQGKTNEGFLL